MLWCAMSPQGPLPLHRGAFSAAHGPSSLCVDLVNYLGCQGPTTAYRRRGRWGGCEGAVRKRGNVRERGREIIIEGWSSNIREGKLQAGVK